MYRSVTIIEQNPACGRLRQCRVTDKHDRNSRSFCRCFRSIVGYSGRITHYSETGHGSHDGARARRGVRTREMIEAVRKL